MEQKQKPSMRSALYYPHTQLRSNFLLSTSLLLWDRVQFIVPHSGYKPQYKNRDVARAVEIIGEQHYPTDAEKQQVHDFIADFVSRPLPEAFIYRKRKQESLLAFRIFHEKFFDKTWDL